MLKTKSLRKNRIQSVNLSILSQSGIEKEKEQHPQQDTERTEKEKKKKSIFSRGWKRNSMLKSPNVEINSSIVSKNKASSMEELYKEDEKVKDLELIYEPIENILPNLNLPKKEGYLNLYKSDNFIEYWVSFVFNCFFFVFFFLF